MGTLEALNTYRSGKFHNFFVETLEGVLLISLSVKVLGERGVNESGTKSPNFSK